MKKIIFTGIILILALVVIVIATHEPAQKAPPLIPPVTNTTGFDPENETYTINEQQFTIKDGIGRSPVAPGSAGAVVTRYFGNKATGDLNGDNTPDYAYLITQEPGGSGTFYYVVAALSRAASSTSYTLTHAVLIGDRIAPQTTEIKDGKIYVNYADRKSTEPMSAQPTVGTTDVFRINTAGELEAVTNQ